MSEGTGTLEHPSNVTSVPQLLRGTDRCVPNEHGYLWVCRNGVHLQLTANAWALLAHVERGSSFGELSEQLARADPTMTEDRVAAAYADITTRIRETEARDPRPPGRFWFRLTIVPQAAVVKIARPLSRVYHPVIAALLVIAAGTTTALVLTRTGASAHLGPGDYAWGYVVLLAILLGHEFGHASACARYGGQPSRIGFAGYAIFLVFFSDVTTAWQLRRWQRCVVDLGGAYFQLLATAVAAVLYAATGWHPALAATLLSLLSVPFVLNPFFKLDGYWLLADALGVQNLSDQRRRVLASGLARLRRSASVPLPWSRPKTLVLGTYSILAIGYWVYILWQFAPAVVAQAADYPRLVAGLVGPLGSGAQLPSGSALVAWLFATYLLCVPALFLRQGVSMLINRFGIRRRAADRLRTSSQPVKVAR